MFGFSRKHKPKTDTHMSEHERIFSAILLATQTEQIDWQRSPNINLYRGAHKGATVTVCYDGFTPHVSVSINGAEVFGAIRTDKLANQIAGTLSAINRRKAEATVAAAIL